MVYVYFVYSGFCPVAHHKGVVSFIGLAGFQRYESIVELCWLAVFIQKVISGDAHVLLINYNCQDFILFKSEVVSINSQVYQYCTFVNGFSPHLFFFILLHLVLYILYHLLLTATLSIIIWIIIIRFIITLFVHFSISTLNAARFFLATFEPSCWAFSTFAGMTWGEFVSIFQPMLLYSIPTNWPNQFIKSRFPLRI